MKAPFYALAASCLLGSALGDPTPTKRTTALESLRQDIADTIIHHRIQNGPDSGKTMNDLASEAIDAAHHTRLSRREEARGPIRSLLQGLGLGKLLGLSDVVNDVTDQLDDVGDGFIDCATGKCFGDDKGNSADLDISAGLDLGNLGNLGDSLDNLGNSHGQCPIEDFLNAVGLGFGDLINALTDAVGDATGALCDAIQTGNGISRRQEIAKTTSLTPSPESAACPINDLLNSLGIGVDDLVKSITKSVGDAKGALCDAAKAATSGISQAL